MFYRGRWGRTARARLLRGGVGLAAARELLARPLGLSIYSNVSVLSSVSLSYLVVLNERISVSVFSSVS